MPPRRLCKCPGCGAVAARRNALGECWRCMRDRSKVADDAAAEAAAAVEPQRLLPIVAERIIKDWGRA